MVHRKRVIPAPEPIGVKEIKKGDSSAKTPLFVILSTAKDLC